MPSFTIAQIDPHAHLVEQLLGYLLAIFRWVAHEDITLLVDFDEAGPPEVLTSPELRPPLSKMRFIRSNRQPGG